MSSAHAHAAHGADAHPSHGHAAHHGDHHGPSLLNTIFIGPYRFERMVLELPFRLAWAFLGFVWGVVRHPIKTMQTVIPKLLWLWIALYVSVAVVSTWRGDKFILGRVDTPFIYTWHGLRYLLADGWRTADTFVGILAHDLGAVTGLHGIVLLAFAMLVPHATILAGIVAACQTIAWWCDYGGVAHAIGTVFGTIAGLAMLVKFVPGMSLGSGGGGGHGGGGGGGHH